MKTPKKLTLGQMWELYLSDDSQHVVDMFDKTNKPLIKDRFAFVSFFRDYETFGKFVENLKHG